jgi:endoglucanase
MIDQTGHSASFRILFHLVVVLFTLSMGANLAQAASDYIRVNQVGYPGSSTKRAYLMASGAETGAMFAAKNSSGTTVFSAGVGTSLGAWGTFTSVYALDFDSVSTAGTYTISVASPIAATSPAFKIDTAANIYDTPNRTLPSLSST